MEMLQKNRALAGGLAFIKPRHGDANPQCPGKVGWNLHRQECGRPLPACQEWSAGDGWVLELQAGLH